MSTFPNEVLRSIFREVKDVKTLVQLKKSNKQFFSIINKFADEFVKFNIKHGITVCAKTPRKTNNVEIKARDKKSYQVSLMSGKKGDCGANNFCICIDNLKNIFCHLRIFKSVKFFNVYVTNEMLTKFGELDYGSIECLKIIGNLKEDELTEMGLISFIARINPTVKLSIRGIFPEKLITDKVLASAPLAYRLTVYSTYDELNIKNPDYSKNLPLVTNQTLLRFVHMHKLHKDQLQQYSLVLPNASITHIGFVQFAMEWTDPNNVENDHIVNRPIYINVHLGHSLAISITEQLLNALPLSIISHVNDDRHKRPQIHILYQLNNKCVKIDFVRFLASKCDRDKYLNMKQKKETKKLLELKNKRKEKRKMVVEVEKMKI